MECPHIPFGQFPVSSGIVFQTRKFFLSPGCMAPGTYFGSGSFPVSMNISFCFRFDLAHFRCWISGTSAHAQDIPDDLLHSCRR